MDRAHTKSFFPCVLNSFHLQSWVTFPGLGSCGPVPPTSGWAMVQQGLSKARVVFEVSSVTLLTTPLALFSTRALNPFQESLSWHSYLKGGMEHKCCVWDVLEVRCVRCIWLLADSAWAFLCTSGNKMALSPVQYWSCSQIHFQALENNLHVLCYQRVTFFHYHTPSFTCH